jgi:hypothetical protein
MNALVAHYFLFTTESEAISWNGSRKTGFGF